MCAHTRARSSVKLHSPLPCYKSKPVAEKGKGPVPRLSQVRAPHHPAPRTQVHRYQPFRRSRTNPPDKMQTNEAKFMSILSGFCSHTKIITRRGVITTITIYCCFCCCCCYYHYQLTFGEKEIFLWRFLESLHLITGCLQASGVPEPGAPLGL